VYSLSAKEKVQLQRRRLAVVSSSGEEWKFKLGWEHWQCNLLLRVDSLYWIWNSRKETSRWWMYGIPNQ